MAPAPSALAELLRSFSPSSRAEQDDLARVAALSEDPDPWDRSLPVHCTGSALVVHPGSRRVLLRWHDRLERWLQVGGHAEPGDVTPFDVAAREAAEETGLPDLEPWPDPRRPTLLQVVVVPVPAGKGEPAHQHADLRFVLATHDPTAASPESERARLRWLSLDDAIDEVDEENLVECLRRVERLFDDR